MTFETSLAVLCVTLWTAGIVAMAAPYLLKRLVTAIKG